MREKRRETRAGPFHFTRHAKFRFTGNSFVIHTIPSPGKQQLMERPRPALGGCAIQKKKKKKLRATPICFHFFT